MQIGQYDNFKWPVEHCKLAISIVRVKLVAAFCERRWKKLATGEELSKAVGRVEEDVVLACGVDVLASVVVDDSEGFNLGDLL